MGKKKKIEDAGMISGADPTAPGGMSQQALVDELIERHGWTKDEVQRWRDGKKKWLLSVWPDMIDAVIDERRGREQEKKAARTEKRAEADAIEAELAEIRAAYERPKPPGIDSAWFQGDPETRDYAFDGHAGAGPSGAHRWMTCTESLGASRKFLETLTPSQQAEFAKSSNAAQQGTTAHRVGEIEAHVLRGQMTRAEADSELMELAIMPPDGVEYDDEMADYVSEYTELIRSFITDRGAENVLIEQRVSAVIPLSGSHDEEVYEVTGSADCVGLPVEDDMTLIVADLKYGIGIDVDVDRNPQIRMYALGVLDSLTDENGDLTVPVESITYYIIQPRLGGIKPWTESLDDLLDWRDDVLSPALTAALYGEGAVFAPEEEACNFCPARGSCKALAEDRISKAADLFDIVDEEHFTEQEFVETVPLLDDKRLSVLLDQAQGVIKIYEDLKAEAQRRLYRGSKLPGWQLVNYTPPRKWTGDAAEILSPALFDDDVFDQETIGLLWKESMLSPTQALAALKKAGVDPSVIEGLIEHPEKKPVIAREGDRRTAWEGRAPEAMFRVETGE